MSAKPQIMVIAGEGFQQSPAVLRALSLARRMDAVLQLRSFEYVRSLDRAAKRGFDLDAYLLGRRAHLEQLAAQLRREGASVESQVIWGHPIAEKLVFETLALKPALVIKDVPMHTDPQRVLLNGLDWHLLNICPAPLMLVQPRAPSLPRHILAAVDPLDENGKPHELNDSIMQTAVSLASQCDAELDVVNAFEYLPMGGEWEYAGWMPDLTLFGDLRKVHADGLYKLGKDHGVPPSRMHILDGETSYNIVHFAEQRHVDLVIMGSIYRKGLHRLMVGSTAEGVFDTLPCDILLIKPQGFAAELAAQLENGKAKAA
jgi:universal stress protein E